jgi:peroxiredoxin
VRQIPPELNLQTDQGETVKLKTLKGKGRPLFYPKDDTILSEGRHGWMHGRAKDFSRLRI